MQYSNLVQRIGGGVDAWKIHSQALAAAARGEDVIVLSVGDPEFAAPASVTEAAVHALRSGDTHSTIAGRTALRQRIAHQHSRQSGQPVQAENVIVVSGAQNGLFCASLCLCGPGDEVYGALTFDAEHVSIASLDGMAGRTVTVSSLSKSHAMAGFPATSRGACFVTAGCRCWTHRRSGHPRVVTYDWGWSSTTSGLPSPVGGSPPIPARGCSHSTARQTDTEAHTHHAHP